MNLKEWTISRRKFLAAFVGLPSLALADGLWIEPDWLKTTTLKLSAGKPPRRLVHFTDLHYKGDRAYLHRVIAQVNSFSADLVCFTGDIVEDARHLPEALDGICAITSPVYGVPGNHDYWAALDFSKIAACFEATGGKWLLDQSALTRDGSLNVCGATCDRYHEFPRVPDTRNLLLIHYPAFVKRLKTQTFDLILAGHSHGGQVRIPLIGAPVVPFNVDQYDLGLFKTEAGPLYVGAGVGYFFAKLRLNCRPEVALIEI